jgi:sarcosine oxidase subunit alpha
MCDVSTLGKVAVQGPDAGLFLDRIYANLISTLPVGRARYGFMLREDGVAWDDGTVWRLGEADWLITATTGRADDVTGWLDRWLQAEWPELRVAVTPVTEAWAGLAVAGPRARAALARVAGFDVSDEALPFMGVAEAPVAGVRARVARISFSGERAYEVYVRSWDAERLWDRMRDAVEAEGGGLYGLEALDILRVEKGHVTHREIDGRVTLADLGMPRMASTKKPFVGSALMGRSALAREDRRRLVGLEPVEPGARVQAGAILFPPGKRSGHGVGHVTSVADSPALGARVALGFAEGGLTALEGAELFALDPTAGRITRLRVRDARFVDPEGARLRG